jgi:hypothetical protein
MQMTSEEFWMRHAPDYNFEMDVDDLVQEAVDKDFIIKLGDDQYGYRETIRRDDNDGI